MAVSIWEGNKAQALNDNIENLFSNDKADELIELLSRIVISDNIKTLIGELVKTQWSDTAKHLLISILKAGLYSNDQSDTIELLATELNREIKQDGIIQSGSDITILWTALNPVQNETTLTFS